MKKHEGFTLIELLVVIMILGILAAYAIPKYMNIDRQARLAVVNALNGSLASGAEMVHAVSIATNNVTTGSVNVGTYNVSTINTTGYPDASAGGIGAAIADLSGFTVTYGAAGNTSGNATAVFTKTGAPTPGNCAVVYTANATGSPTIAINASGSGC